MKKISFLLVIPFIFITSLFLGGCTSNEKKQGTLEIYTTIFPLQSFTEAIGGKYVHVTSIYPAGADAHTYEPSQKRIVQLAKSDLFIYNGVDLEPFVKKVEPSLHEQKVKIVNSSKGVELIGSEEDPTEEASHQHNQDPHIWIDPINASKQAENIKNALVQLQPEHKEEFERNFKALQAKLMNLDTELKTTIQNARTKEVLVSHRAYGYWEHRYGLKQIPIVGISSADEPSQRELATLTKTAKEHQLQYIVFETFSTPKVAEIVQKETGTKILRIHHLATISKQDAANKKDYVQLMQENIKTLQTALQ